MLTGGCLCGAVRYQTDAAPVFAGYCHCQACVRISAGARAALFGVPRAQVTLTGETKEYVGTGGSGLATRRHFCPTCGTYMYGAPDAVPGVLNFSIGTLDEPSAIAPQVAIFARSRPTWDRSADDLPSFEELPPSR